MLRFLLPFLLWTGVVLADDLRRQLADQGVVALSDEDFAAPDAAKVALGRSLFFDRILSGNQTVACSSCHVPRHGSTQRESLSLDGATRGVLGKILAPRLGGFVPRNTTDLFNRGHRSFTKLFADGRVEMLEGVLSTPSGTELPEGLDGVLAAQALHPLLSDVEMLGRPGENPLAGLSSPKLVWNGLLKRVLSYAAYRRLFAKAYPDTPPASWSIAHVANALAAYESFYYRADASPFDRYLRGDDHALTAKQKAGAALFYGDAKCARCHSGALQTDHAFHAVAMPQLGPGKGNGFLGRDDFGRENVTGRRDDRYRFHTPSLRNVALTAPYGHDGAYRELRTAVVHMLNPQRGLDEWRRTQALLIALRFPTGFFSVYGDLPSRDALKDACELSSVTADAELLLAFLGSLTDTSFQRRPGLTPATVASGKRDFIFLLPNLAYLFPKSIIRK